MQTIITKYMPATNTRGSRIKAYWAKDRSLRPTITLPYPYELRSEQAHDLAALELLNKTRDPNPYECHRAAGVDERGYCYVLVPTGTLTPTFTWPGSAE